MLRFASGTNAVTSMYMQRHSASQPSTSMVPISFLTYCTIHRPHTSLLNLGVLHFPIARFFGFPDVSIILCNPGIMQARRRLVMLQ